MLRLPRSGWRRDHQSASTAFGSCVFADLFPNPDERALGRAIAVRPQVHLAGIKIGINPIGPAGEQGSFTHHYPLGETTGGLESNLLLASSLS